MFRFPPRMLRPPGLVAACAAFLLAIAGCSTTHHKSLSPGSSNGTVASGASTSTTSPAAANSGPNTTTASGARSAGGSSATTLEGNRPSGTLPINTGSSPSSSGAPNPATPGTYTMDQSGGVTTTPNLYSSSEPPQGTLVVDKPQPNGIQVDHRYVDQSNQPANTTTQFLPTGPVILSTTEGAGPNGISCTFNPPIPAPPWPPAVGKTFSAQGNCGNGNSVSVQGKIVGTQTATLKDGEAFTVWVVDSTLTISGQINATGSQVDWYSSDLRLPVHEQTDVRGTYSGIQFTLHSVSDLVSSHPT